MNFFNPLGMKSSAASLTAATLAFMLHITYNIRALTLDFMVVLDTCTLTKVWTRTEQDVRRDSCQTGSLFPLFVSLELHSYKNVVLSPLQSSKDDGDPRDGV